MSNNHNDSETEKQQYETETGQKVSTSNISGSAAVPRDSEVGKWSKSDKGFWGFTNYDNLLSEYKSIIPRQAGWKAQITDPFSGTLWYAGVNVNDRAREYTGTEVLRVWMIESKPRGSGGSGGSGSYAKSRVWYNPIGCELIDVKSANGLLATNDENKSGTRYRIQNSHTIKEMKEDLNNPGKSLVTESVLVLLVLEKRIEF